MSRRLRLHESKSYSMSTTTRFTPSGTATSHRSSAISTCSSMSGWTAKQFWLAAAAARQTDTCVTPPRARRIPWVTCRMGWSLLLQPLAGTMDERCGGRVAVLIASHGGPLPCVDDVVLGDGGGATGGVEHPVARPQDAPPVPRRHPVRFSAVPTGVRVAVGVGVAFYGAAPIQLDGDENATPTPTATRTPVGTALNRTGCRR